MLLPTVAIVVFLSLSGASQAATCPTFVTQKDFDVIKYAGLWYEAYRTENSFEIGTKCANATYTLNADGSVGVWNQGINSLGQYTSIKGFATVKNPADPAALAVTFDNQSRKGDYNVIKTDYFTYSLVYACNDIPSIGKLEFIWILSRLKTVSPIVFYDLQRVLIDMGVSTTALKATIQNC